MRNKISKRLIIVAPIIFLLIIAIGIGLSFGYMQYSKKQEENNPFKAACYNVTYKEANEGVSIENGYPISDEDGLKSEPYSLTVTNNCSTALTYDVLINVMNSSTTPEDYIKVAYNDEPSLLSDNEKVDTEVSDAKYAYAVGHGVIESKQSTTINLKSWLASTVTGTQAENTYFANKVSIQMNANNLATKIINNNTVLTDTIENLAKAEPRGINFSETVNENINVNILNGIRVGTSYDFDANWGIYTIINPSVGGAMASGDYICQWSARCTTMYKIKEVNESVVTLADEYTTNYERETNGSGLYKLEDDDGPTYIFRGEIENNYVEFAKSIWRIIRINGDGSIRLINASTVANDTYYSNLEDGDKRKLGYSYDNVYDSNGFVLSGTDSVIKMLVDTWYENNLKEYENKIATTTFCNDTSSQSNLTGAEYRSNNNMPSLKCPITDKTYGGRYKLKAGLINVDECNIAGLENYYDYPHTIAKNYLSNIQNNWTLSPSNNFIYYTERVDFNVNSPNSLRHSFAPVINLKSNVKVSSGDGTKEKPYVID